MKTGWSGGRQLGLPDAAAVGRHHHLECAVLRPELHVATPRATAFTLGDGLLQRLAQPWQRLVRAAGIAADLTDDILNQPGRQALTRNLQREEEPVCGHAQRFYSESRSKSTCAFVQSAAICVRRASSDSNARSSRRRCTKPRRTEAP